MFPGTKDFKAIFCPNGANCSLKELNCPFSHAPSVGKRTYYTPLTAKSSFNATSEVKRPQIHKSPAPDVGKMTAVSQNFKDYKIPLEINSKVPWKIRQVAFEKIVATLDTLNKNPIEMEREIYNQSKTKDTYRILFASLLQNLRNSNVATLNTEKDDASLNGAILSQLSELIHPKDVLIKNGYVFKDSPEGSILSGSSYTCQRCKIPFDPYSYYKSINETNLEPCRYHHGKTKKSQSLRIYECCHKQIGEIGCTEAQYHVYCSSEISLTNLHFIDSWDSNSEKYPIVAIDAEMIYTERGNEIARLSIVDWDCKIILDEFILVGGQIIDFNTRFSGIDETIYNSKSNIDKAKLIEMLKGILGRETIIVGHSLENDFRALGVSCNRVIDTSILFPHGGSLNAKFALKYLSKTHLKEFIQEGSQGHSSVEDAIACMKLVKSFMGNI